MTQLNRFFLRSKKGQATTEVVLLFPFFVVFILFIIKIFGLLVLSQKMEIAGYYAARRYQLQSHVSDYYHRTWDKRFLIKDIQKKVESYLGLDKPGGKQFLSLEKINLDINTSGTWVRVVLTAKTRAPRIRFLCKYNRDQICENDNRCIKGYDFLCETGGEVTVTKYMGHNERVVPYRRPEGKS